MIEIIADFIKDGRSNALWRFMEVTRYRSQILAARLRAEENFEDS